MSKQYNMCEHEFLRSATVIFSVGNTHVRVQTAAIDSTNGAPAVKGKNSPTPPQLKKFSIYALKNICITAQYSRFYPKIPLYVLRNLCFAAHMCRKGGEKRKKVIMNTKKEGAIKRRAGEIAGKCKVGKRTEKTAPMVRTSFFQNEKK